MTTNNINDEIISNLKFIGIKCFPNFNFKNPRKIKMNYIDYIVAKCSEGYLKIVYNFEDNIYEILFDNNNICQPSENVNGIINNFYNDIYWIGKSKDKFKILLSFIPNDILKDNKIYYNQKTEYILFGKYPKTFGMYNRNYKEISFEELF